MINLLRKLIAKVDETPIILAHHPLCGKFEDHYFKIKGRSICFGCFTVYPSVLVTFIIMFFLYPALNISFVNILFISIILFIINFLRFIPRMSHKQVLPLNIILGTSISLVFFSVLRAPDFYIQIYLLGFIFVIFSIFSFYKGWRIFLECKKCQEYANFPYCKKIRNNSKNHK